MRGIWPKISSFLIGGGAVLLVGMSAGMGPVLAAQQAGVAAGRCRQFARLGRRAPCPFRGDIRDGYAAGSGDDRRSSLGNEKQISKAGRRASLQRFKELRARRAIQGMRYT